LQVIYTYIFFLTFPKLEIARRKGASVEGFDGRRDQPHHKNSRVHVENSAVFMVGLQGRS
jgi:hypothetical protein